MRDDTTATTTADPRRGQAIVGYRFAAHTNLVDAMDPEETGSWFPHYQSRTLVEVLADTLRRGRVATISTYRSDDWRAPGAESAEAYERYQAEAEDEPGGALLRLIDYAQSGAL